MPNRSTAPSATTTTWTTSGVIAMPVSAVLLALGTLTPQPDQASDGRAATPGTEMVAIQIEKRRPSLHRGIIVTVRSHI